MLLAMTAFRIPLRAIPCQVLVITRLLVTFSPSHWPSKIEMPCMALFSAGLRLTTQFESMTTLRLVAPGAVHPWMPSG